MAAFDWDCHVDAGLARDDNSTGCAKCMASVYVGIEKGKIERFQFRDIRAKNATDEAELTVAQARLGHTSSDIAQKVYIRRAKKVRPLR